MDEHIRIETTQNVAIQYEVASVGDRLTAYFLDFLIIFAYIVFFVFFISQIGIFSSMVEGVLIMAPVLFYDLFCEIFLNGQSIGKRARQIKVAKLDGTQPSLFNYIMRWMLRPIDIWLASGVIGLVVILWKGNGQRLGDIAAGTTVIKLKQRVTLDDTILTQVAENYTVSIPEVEMLSDYDIEVVKEVMNNYHKMADFKLRRTLTRKAQISLEKKMSINSGLSPEVFLETILQDYNYIKGKLD